MKKYVIICFFIFIFLISGCGKIDFKQKILENVSENVENFYVGNSEKLNVSVQSGEREKEYLLDGKHFENTEFCLITVLPKDCKFENTKSFILYIDGKSFEGEFEINPYNNSLMYDLGFTINNMSKLKITINLDDVFEIINLTNQCEEWKIEKDDAVSIACDEVYNQMKKYIKNSIDLEIYIRILYDTTNLKNPFYWYVGFYTIDDTNVYVIIDVNSGEIILSE